MAEDPRRAATIYAVAARAGVSTATVSRALAGSPKVAARTRDAVLEAARELDYLPAAAARALAGNRSNALGLVMPHIAGSYYAELLVGFEIAASRLGLSVVITLANPRSDSRAAVRDLAAGVDGIAFMARSAAKDALITEISGRLPVVTGARAALEGTDAFFVENREPARLLTEHLIAAGRTRLAFVGHPERGSDIGSRHRGFRDAMAAADLEPGERFDVSPLEKDGFDVADRLLKAGLPFDALVCGNDELALAVMQRLQDNGVSVPDDVAIVGWDDTVTARYVRPGLTTVDQPVSRLGAMAAERLAQLIDGGEPDTAPITLPSTLVHRASCGCSAPSELTTRTERTTPPERTTPKEFS